MGGAAYRSRLARSGGVCYSVGREALEGLFQAIEFEGNIDISACGSDTMKLAIDGLKGSSETFRYSIERGWWDERFADVEASGILLVGEPVIEIRARVRGENVGLKGELEGMLDAECGRCTRRYRQVLRDSFRLILAPLGDGEMPADPEGVHALERSGMCLGEDLEAGWYRGPEIELGEFFVEIISLAIPVQPLCDDECPGLCPACGISRSEQKCNCEDSKPASPFAVLAALREKTEGSS
jgi:uncharacterized protein